MLVQFYQMGQDVRNVDVEEGSDINAMFKQHNIHPTGDFQITVAGQTVNGAYKLQANDKVSITRKEIKGGEEVADLA